MIKIGAYLMNVFFLGDFKSNTGPAIANKLMKKGLSDLDNIKFSDANNLVMRVLEVILNTIMFDNICICSFSKINYIAINLAKLLNKNIYYIMHGYVSYENSINNIDKSKENDKLIKLEKYILKNSKKVFCVSKKFMEFIIEKEPEYSHKFDFIYNGIDIEEIEKNARFYKGKKDKNQIISIGGGMKRKNNLTVCKVIEILNSKYNMNLKYIVIGLPYTDKNEICKFNFVEYYDYLPHDKVLRILGQSNLYIQNSSFETFGLAIVEALFSGCNLLISNNVGVIDLFKDLNEMDIIYDTNSVEEIARKIENVLINNNSSRLKERLEISKINYRESAKLLKEKLGLISDL